MDKILFTDLPNMDTPIDAENLNKLQDNVESVINENNNTKWEPVEILDEELDEWTEIDNKHLVNKKNREIFNGIIPRYEKAIETFSITLENGYSFVENMQNQCYYNKNTKQVTLVYYINGPIPYDTWTTIGTIPEKYRPPKTIYIESTAGVVRAVIQISNNGIVQAWIPRVANSNPLNNVRGTGVYYTF